MGARKRIIKKIRSSALPSCYSYKYRVKPWSIAEIISKQKVLKRAIHNIKNSL